MEWPSGSKYEAFHALNEAESEQHGRCSFGDHSLDNLRKALRPTATDVLQALSPMCWCLANIALEITWHSVSETVGLGSWTECARVTTPVT
eukprot:6360360-Amphidinium_carterae.1